MRPESSIDHVTSSFLNQPPVTAFVLKVTTCFPHKCIYLQIFQTFAQTVQLRDLKCALFPDTFGKWLDIYETA
jgi:hypothetical protein